MIVCIINFCLETTLLSVFKYDDDGLVTESNDGDNQRIIINLFAHLIQN